MARTNKVGLDYFPFDVDFFEDDKLQLIEAEFGPKGLIAAIKLLCKIYKSGYYYKWGDDECLLFTKNAGASFVPDFINELVAGLVRRCFFDKRCYDLFGILTSAGIQQRYFDATARYKKVTFFEEYLLVNLPERNNVVINRINVFINPINVNANATKENEKESKKENEREIENLAPPEQRYSEYLNQGAIVDPSINGNSTGPEFEEVHLFFVQNGFDERYARSFHDRYSATGWVIGGSKITNWRALAQKWFREPNKYDQKPTYSPLPASSKLTSTVSANQAAKEKNAQIYAANNQNR